MGLNRVIAFQSVFIGAQVLEDHFWKKILIS